MNLKCPRCLDSVKVDSNDETVTCPTCTYRFARDGSILPSTVKQDEPFLSETCADPLDNCMARRGHKGRPAVKLADTNRNTSPKGDFSGGSRQRMLGTVLIALGFMACGYFGIIYDTSVYTESIPEIRSGSSLIPDLPAIPSRRVENIGKLNMRQTGITVGVGIAIMGTILFVTNRRGLS